MSVHVDPAENFHPYECDGPGFCVHCDRLHIVCGGDEGTGHYSHDPSTCELCDPSYDGLNNPYRDKE